MDQGESLPACPAFFCCLVFLCLICLLEIPRLFILSYLLVSSELTHSIRWLVDLNCLETCCCAFH
jgi:hypothetical protein